MLPIQREGKRYSNELCPLLPKTGTLVKLSTPYFHFQNAAPNKNFKKWILD